jgi:hypothetical protein
VITFFFATLALAAIVGTIVVALRDGYRRVPTLRR